MVDKVTCDSWVTGTPAFGLPDRHVTTWSGRTQLSKNQDSIHIRDFKLVGRSDQQVIQAAVDYCFENDRTLNWDGIKLTSTSNIANFWSVTHIGDGAITRGDITFKITPISTDQTNLYVATTGVATNDGLSPDCAVGKLATVNIILCATVSDQRMGTWQVNFAAGTYADSYNFISLPQFQKPVRFVGAGSRYNPLTIFDGALSSYKTAGMYFMYKARVYVQYMQFQNFPDGYGVLVERNCDAEYNDCVSINCNVGFSAGYNSYARSSRCIAENCVTGFRGASNACVSYTPNTNSIDDANIARKCTNGMLLTRNSYSHFDYNIIEDCTRGVLIEINSRGAVLSNNIKRCQVGIAGWSAGFVSGVSTNNFNLNTIDACTRSTQWRGTSAPIELGQNYTAGYSLECLSSSQTYTGSLDPQQVTNGIQVEGCWFVDRSARLKMKVTGMVTTTDLGLYNIQPRFAGSTLSSAQVPSNVANQPFTFECEVFPVTASTQKTVSTLLINGLPPIVSVLNTSVSVHLTQDVRFNLYVDIGGGSGAGASVMTVDSVVVTREG